MTGHDWRQSKMRAVKATIATSSPWIKYKCFKASHKNLANENIYHLLYESCIATFLAPGHRWCTSVASADCRKAVSAGSKSFPCVPEELDAVASRSKVAGEGGTGWWQDRRWVNWVCEGGWLSGSHWILIPFLDLIPQWRSMWTCVSNFASASPIRSPCTMETYPEETSTTAAPHHRMQW